MIPLIYFLIAWVVFLAIYALMALLSVVQMLRFGLTGLGTYLSTFFYLAVASGALIVCALYFSGVDWTGSVNLFGDVTSSVIFSP
ncbi:MAG: hypothetical protein WC641_04820 [Patescibacteria group bacterium]